MLRILTQEPQVGPRVLPFRQAISCCQNWRPSRPHFELQISRGRLRKMKCGSLQKCAASDISITGEQARLPIQIHEQEALVGLIHDNSSERIRIYT